MNITKRFAPSRKGVVPSAIAGALLLGVCLVSGCMSSTTQVAAPVAPPQGAIDTGTYPNLNIPPETAAEPISDDDRSRITSRIGAAQGSQAASGRGAGTQGDPEVLRRLAERHGDDTLAAIAAR